MKLLGLLSLLSLSSTLLAFNLNTPLPSVAEDNPSLLNYDTALGRFRDLTATEVQSYYSDLASKDGLKGDELLASLSTILRNDHQKISNSKAWSSGWELFLLLDRDYLNDPLTEDEISSQDWKTDYVLVNPLYTDDLVWVRSDERHFDREHMWPKSRGFKDRYDTSEKLSEQPYAATDMHNLRMAEHTNNSTGHNNDPYGVVVDKTASSTTPIESVYTGQVTGYRGLNKDGITVYEPRDEDKGDIARGLFYMAARYHTYYSTEDFEPALRLVSSFSEDPTITLTCDSTKETPATYGILKDLLAWHKADPVDEFEIHRNNLCYNFVQNNRNPFVDYPEWVDVAFGDTTYGIDLDSPTGVAKTGLTINSDQWDTDTLKVGDTINLNDLSFTYYDASYVAHELTLNDVTYNITLNGQNIEPSNGVITIEEGTYNFKFSYTDNGQTYEAEITFSVSQSFFENYQLYILIGAAIIAIIVIILLLTGVIKTKKKKSKKKSKKSTKKKSKRS